MDDLCRIRRDKKLLNWHIPVPDRVIFQEYFKSLMDVCQKFLEGKASFFIQNYNYNFWMHWLKSIFIAYCHFSQRLFIYVNSTELIDSTVSSVMPEPGGPGGPLAPPIFCRSVNPIRTGEGRLSPPITTGPPNVFHLPASLATQGHCTPVAGST